MGTDQPRELASVWVLVSRRAAAQTGMCAAAGGVCSPDLERRTIWSPFGLNNPLKCPLA